MQEIPTLRDQIFNNYSTEEWFVPSIITPVENPSNSCCQNNSIRYFHKTDENRAKELKEYIKKKKGQNFSDKFTLVDLSEWAETNNLNFRRGQFELWFMGNNCDAQS